MAITLFRIADQEGLVDMRNPEINLHYFVKADGADKFDETAIEAAVLAGTPADYGGLNQRSPRIKELGNGVYEAFVTYRLLEGQPVPALSGADVGLNPPPEPGQPGAPPPPPAETDALDESYSFSTTGGTQHITHAIRQDDLVDDGLLDGTGTHTAIGRGREAPNWDDGIGVDGMKLNGCDVYTPQLELSVVRTIPKVSMGYVKVLRELTATVNVKSYYHHEPGSLLFMGASGQTRGPETKGGWNVTYTFGLSPNLTNVIIVQPEDENDPGLIVPEKRGWDYLWVWYAAGQAGDGGPVGPKPDAVYVSQVYRYANHHRLRI